MCSSLIWAHKGTFQAIPRGQNCACRGNVPAFPPAALQPAGGGLARRLRAGAGRASAICKTAVRGSRGRRQACGRGGGRAMGPWGGRRWPALARVLHRLGRRPHRPLDAHEIQPCPTGAPLPLPDLQQLLAWTPFLCLLEIHSHMVACALDLKWGSCDGIWVGMHLLLRMWLSGLHAATECEAGCQRRCCRARCQPGLHRRHLSRLPQSEQLPCICMHTPSCEWTTTSIIKSFS